MKGKGEKDEYRQIPNKINERKNKYKDIKGVVLGKYKMP